jgi:hypothetical protein
MNLIDVNSIRDIKLKSGKNSISFHDKHHEYSFLLSKNTLFKRFLVQELQSFPVEILGNPLDKIHQFLSVNGQPSKLTTLFDTDLLVSRYSSKSRIIDTIFLPLYGKNKKVGERSGLNQWNARGRERHPNEVYIPIPAMVHKIAPSFFPDRDTSFDLLLPNEKLMIAKVYQDNSKALMSYSNRELGEWILRQVLGLKCGEVLTYEKLLDLRIDSVRLDKTENSTFEINFSAVGAYDNWLEEIDNAE